MVMSMLILGATVLERETGTDIISLWTNLSEATYPYTGMLALEFRAAKGQGKPFLEAHFPNVPLLEKPPADMSVIHAKMFHSENHWSEVRFDICQVSPCKGLNSLLQQAEAQARRR